MNRLKQLIKLFDEVYGGKDGVCGGGGFMADVHLNEYLNKFM